jgi:hypothetical protein
MISVKESYELFKATLSHLDKSKLEQSDEDLEYYIFAELSGDAVSFLHEWTVDRLIVAKIIPDELRANILELRNQILKQLEKTNFIEQYRTDSNWKIIRNQADYIKQKIMFETLGNKVRVVRTTETEEKGLADKEGEIYGKTSPSMMDFEVVGELKEDIAFNVFFEETNESIWFAEQLIEEIDNGVGATITLDGIDKR